MEPIDLPPAIEQGVDMIYIDEDLVPKAVHDNGPMGDMNFAAWSGAPVDLFTSVNPIYTELRRGLVKYQQRWGDLPQVPVPGGPALKPGSTGERVAALRARLGLAAGGSYDAALAGVVKEFQSLHGLKADGIAGAGTVEALNKGPEYYEQLIMINMERAKRLPAPEEQRKYAIVDAGDARLSLWENGRKVDEMKVVVGKAESATPMMAAYIKYASVNPYWNVPPDLVKNLIAPRIVAQGVSYLTTREYQVLSDLSENAQVIDPHIGRLAGGRRWAPGSRSAPPSEPGEFDGHDEIHVAQLLRHLSPRFAGEGAFHQERAVDQQRLRARRGLQALREVPVRRRCPQGRQPQG